MNYTGYSVLKIPKTGAAFAYAKEARDFATGATGVGGYLRSDATTSGWTDVRFVSAILEGSSSLPLSIGASNTNLYTGLATVIGGSTPIGDLRSEDGPYVGVGNSSVYSTKKGQEYGAAFYATYIGGTNSAPKKIGIGTSSNEISTSGYYEGNFTTRNINEFESNYNADLDDPTKIITGSGVYTNGADISLQFNILNRNGELLTSAAQIAADPFVSKQIISILDTNSNVVFPNYRTNGDSTFNFSRSQNIDVFGSYNRNFGIRNEVVNQDGGITTGEFYLYANTATFDGVIVQASGETSLNQNLSNHSPPNTGTITSAADRADAIKYFNDQPINTSGSTGFIELTLNFNESPNFTNLGDVNIWNGTSGDFDTNRGSFVGNYPLNSLQEGQKIILTANDGIIEGTGLFFKLIADSAVGFEPEILTIGPYTLEPNIEGPDLNVYNQSIDQQIIVSDLSIQGGVDGNATQGGHLGIGTSAVSSSQMLIEGNNTSVEIANSEGYAVNSEQKSALASIGGTISSTGSMIAGGSGHHISGDFDTIAGGALGNISGGDFNFIGGGSGIDVTNSDFSSSLGGRNNDVSGADFSVILGGNTNSIITGQSHFIGGGSLNQISGTNANGDFSNSLVGGTDNRIFDCQYSFIGAGASNTIYSSSSVIGGGSSNIASGDSSVVFGGTNNQALANKSVAAGAYSKVQAGHHGAFVFSDSNSTPTLSTGANTATLNFEDGVYVQTTSGLYVNGNPVVTGSTAGTDTLQTVTNRGNVTTTSIKAAHISGSNLTLGNGVTDASIQLDGDFGGGDLTLQNLGSNQDILFKVNDGGVTTTPFTIQGSTSNIGIGTDSPSTTLDVRGHEIAVYPTGVLGSLHLGESYGYLGLFGTSNGGAISIPEKVVLSATNRNTSNSSFIEMHSRYNGTSTGSFGDIDLHAGYFPSSEMEGDINLITSGQKRLVAKHDGNVGIGVSDPDATLQIKAGDTTGFLVQSSAGKNILWAEDNETINARSTFNVYNTTVASRYLRLSWGSIFGNDDGNELTLGSNRSSNTATRIFIAAENADNTPANTIQMQANHGLAVFSGNAQDVFEPTALIDVRGDAYISGSVEGTGAGNRITNNGVPYLLSGDSPAENDTLQDVTTRGNTTNTSIISTGPYISGVTGLFSDKVGIGATAPSVGLQLGNSASGETKTAIFNSEGGAEIGLTIKSRTNRAKLAVSDNDTTAYVVAEGTIASFGRSDTAASTNISVLANGNVGIGSTSPSRLLTLENNSSTVSNNSQLRINNIGAGDAYIYLFAGSDWSLGIDNSDSDKFKLCTTNDVSDGTEVVTVDRSGNVGIGTTIPDSKLSVTSSTINSEDILYLKSGADSVNDYLGIAWEIGAGGNGPHSAIRSFAGPSASDARLGFLTTSNGGTTLTEGLSVAHNGNVGIGITNPTVKLHVDGGINVAGHIMPSTSLSYDLGSDSKRFASAFCHGLSASSSVTTPTIQLQGNLKILNKAQTSYLDLAARDTSGSEVRYNLNYVGNVSLNGELNFTTNGDKYIDVNTIANGNSFNIRHHNPTGNVFKTAFQSAANGATTLYYNGAARFATTTDGIQLYGNGYLDMPDNGRIRMGANYDFAIYHDGFNSYINNATGDLYIQQNANDKDLVFQCDDGSGGTTPYLTLDGSSTGLTVSAPQGMAFFDDIKAKFGNNDDLQIFHDGSHSYISDAGTGDLRIQGSNNIVFYSYQTSEVMASMINNGGVELYFNNSKKFQTTADGIDVSGFAIADVFRTDPNNSEYSLLTRTGASPSLYVQSVSSNTNQPIALFSYGSATAAAGNKVLSVARGLSYFDNTNVGIGTTAPEDKLDIVGNLRICSSKTANTNKTNRIRGEHYNVAEEPTTLMFMNSFSATNQLYIGGGSSIENAATSLTFFTAANNTTTAGTLALTIDSSQNATFAGDVTVSGGDITLGGTGRIQGIDTVTASTDAANKAYVDAQVGSADTLQEVTDNGNTTTNSIITSNSVGIGTTTNPPHRLVVTDGASPYSSSNILLQVKRNSSNGNDDTSRSAIMLANNSNAFTIAYGGTTDRLRFIDGGNSEALTILNGGRVGIGTTAPNASTLLHVQGVIGTTNGSAAAPTHSFYGDPDNGMFRAAANALGFSTSGTERMRISSTGEVVIYSGQLSVTNSTGAQLQVSGWSDRVGSNNSANGTIYIGNTAAYRGVIDYDAASTGNLIISNTWNNANGDIVFKTATADTAIEGLRIKGGGNVGIGTTSPDKKLEVSGDIKISGGDYNGLFFENASGTTKTLLYQHATYDALVIKDIVNNADRVTFKNNGNVGINTTSPSYQLEVNGGILAGGKVTYHKSAGSLTTTGYAVAGLTSFPLGNGASAGFTFTCFGHLGDYQKIVYSCYNASGTWNTQKVIDEGTNDFDVTASANGSTITFTFKSRSGTKSYTPRVSVEAFGSSINNTYA